MAAAAQFITDVQGNRISVIVSIQEYQKLLDAMEELEDIAAYDKAKNSDNEYIALDDAFGIIEQKRKENALRNSH